MINLEEDKLVFTEYRQPQPKWCWTISSFDEFVVHQQTAPNWFHRLMQRLFFGIK